MSPAATAVQTAEPLDQGLAPDRIATLLRAAARGDWTGATLLPEDDAGLRRGPARALLAALAERRLKPIEAAAGLFLVEDIPDATSEVHAALLAERRDAVAALLELPPPPVVLAEIVDDDLPFAFAEPIGAHATYIRLTPAACTPSVVAHELAHAFLRSGNRILDEGLADWIADGVCDEAIAPTADEPRLADLLAIDFAGDVHFDSIAPDADARRRLRARAATLVAAIHAAGGADGLKAIFATASGNPPIGDLVDRIERMLDRPIDGADGRNDALAAIRDDIHAAQVAGDADALSACAERAFALAARSPGWRAIDAGVVALFGVARERIRADADDQASTVAVADAWVAKAKALGLPAGRIAALAGHRAILAIVAARRANLRARVAVSARQAERHLRAAIAADPDDLDAHAALAYLVDARPGAANAADDSAARLIAAHPDARGALAATPVAEPAVALHDVTAKGDGGFTLAIDDFTIARGERIALVGSNGSGKSTLIDAILGLLPCRGRIELFGERVGAAGLDPARRRRIGAVLNQAPLSQALKVGEAVAMLDSVFGCADPRVHAAMGLDELRGKRMSALSRGQYQRVMIYAGLGHDADLLLLDEASLGLDAHHARELRTLLFGDWGRARTIVICSHLPTDLDRVDRVVMLKAGRIARQGGVQRLVRSLDWTWRGELSDVDAAACAGLVAALPEFVRHQIAGRRLTAFGGPAFGQAFAALAASLPTVGHALSRATIQDVIREIDQ